MRVSVILSTYNSPDWLAKALAGYSVQSHGDFELFVADDGSTDETRRRIDAFRCRTDLVVHHIWHEDRGFRKCTILNRAVEATVADYLVFSDGDCIPRRDFVARHVELARPGCYLSGGLLRLPRAANQRITEQDILIGRATDPHWLRSIGIRWSSKFIKLQCQPPMSRWLDSLTPTKPTWNGHNSSAWKADLLRVNGFDERMEWGGEDREMGERLVHIGVRPIQVRHRAACVHLDHDRSYLTADAMARNRKIWSETRRTKATWTPYGIVKQPVTQPRAA